MKLCNIGKGQGQQRVTDVCIGREWGRVLFFLWGQSFWDVPTCPALGNDPQLCTCSNSILLDTWELAHTNQCSQYFTIIGNKKLILRHVSRNNIKHPSQLHKLPCPWGHKTPFSRLAFSPDSAAVHDLPSVYSFPLSMLYFLLAHSPLRYVWRLIFATVLIP